MKTFYIPIHYYENEPEDNEFVMFMTRRDIDETELKNHLNDIAGRVMMQTETHSCGTDVVDSIFTELTKDLSGTWSYCRTLPRLVIGDPDSHEDSIDMHEISVSKLATLLIELKPGEGLDFYESYDEETGEMDGIYGARMVNEFDSHVIFIKYYGGGYPCAIDVTCYDSDLKRITEDLEEYLRDAGLHSRQVYVKTGAINDS